MNVAINRKSPFFFLIIFVLGFILECIPQEAEARGRGRAFGRRGVQRGAVRRVNRNRGFVRRNNVGRARIVVRNNDIFGLDQEPVNAFSSLALNPFGQLQPIVNANGQVVSGLATDGTGRFFAVNNGFNNFGGRFDFVNGTGFNNFGVNNVGFDANLGNLTNNLQVQAELLRSGNGFFGSVSAINGAFSPATTSTEAFNQLQFLNTVGTLGTSCNGRFCTLR